jgi:iron complex transport system ATP-binding protein
MSVLEARDASVWRDDRWILDSANVRVSPGELKAVVGPNGGGKSTLLRSLAGIWSVDRGAVLLDDKKISSLPRNNVAKRIAFVPQEQRIEFAFTVTEVVEMGRHPHRGRFAGQSAHDRQAVATALERCDIAHLRARSVHTLSGGEHQRVLIARSLAVEPEFILLDEPTASLDVEHSLEVMELCRTLAGEGQAVVLATHDLNAATRYASSIILVEAGRVMDYGKHEQVLSPENVERAFGVRAELLTTSEGQPVYVFHPLDKHKEDKHKADRLR